MQWRYIFWFNWVIKSGLQFTGWIYLLGNHGNHYWGVGRYKLEPITRLSLSYLVYVFNISNVKYNFFNSVKPSAIEMDCKLLNISLNICVCSVCYLYLNINLYVLHSKRFSLYSTKNFVYAIDVSGYCFMKTWNYVFTSKLLKHAQTDFKPRINVNTSLYQNSIGLIELQGYLSNIPS